MIIIYIPWTQLRPDVLWIKLIFLRHERKTESKTEANISFSCFAFYLRYIFVFNFNSVGIQRLRSFMRIFPAVLLGVKSYGFSNYIPRIQTTVNNQQPCFFIQSVFFRVVNMHIGNLRIIKDLIKTKWVAAKWSVVSRYPFSQLLNYPGTFEATHLN